MRDLQLDTSALSRRVVRAVCDLAHRPLTGLRILDLACAHGHYAIEMAKLGGQVLGIEGRESWLEQARLLSLDAGVANVEFVQDDVRNLSKEKYGEFDIVLCLGILYHLDAPDVFDFVNSIFDVCRDFAIIETHFATAPVIEHQWRGRSYWGESTFEHSDEATPEEKLKNLSASLDNPRSFWFTQASLCNILQHVGFTSVFDCRVPLAAIYVGPEWNFEMWGNRMTLAAMKGRPLELYRGPGTPPESEADWPEDPSDRLFERRWYLRAVEAAPESEQQVLPAEVSEEEAPASLTGELESDGEAAGEQIALAEADGEQEARGGTFDRETMDDAVGDHQAPLGLDSGLQSPAPGKETARLRRFISKFLRTHPRGRSVT